MLFRVILWVLLFYFIYKFVFDFLVPLLKVSRQMNQQVKGFRHFSQQQSEKTNQNSSAEKKEAPKEKAGEYIDFEEVKEK
jgi:cell division protein FtsB